MRFFSLLTLHEAGPDVTSHSVVIQTVAPDQTVPAIASPHRFVYGRKLDADSPGGYYLGTEFNFEATLFGTYWVQAWLDGVLLTQVPLLIRRTP